MLAALAAAHRQVCATAIEFTGNELRLKGPGARAAEQQAAIPACRPVATPPRSEGDTLVVRQGAPR
jgi:hypothetical protein